MATVSGSAPSYGVESVPPTSGLYQESSNGPGQGGNFWDWLKRLLPGIGRGAANAASNRQASRNADAGNAFAHNRNLIDLYGTQDRGAVDRYGIDERGTTSRYNTHQNSILDAMGLGEKGTMDRANLALDQQKFQVAAPQVRGRTALMGDMLNYGSNMSMTPPPGVNMPQIHGGYTWDSMSPEVRQMGRTMLLQALQQQTAGDQPNSPPMQNFNAGVLAPPPMTPMPPTTPPTMLPIPQGGGLDTFLNVLSSVGGTIGALDPYTQRSRPAGG